MYNLLKLISAIFLFAAACQGQPSNHIEPEVLKYHEDSISLLADTLPEFKNDPHVKETQGNQISGVVRTMMQDRDDNYWFGTQNGLCRYDGNQLLYFDIRDASGDKITIMAIDEDKHGNIWVGSTGGLVKFDGTYFSLYSEENGLVDNHIWAVEVDQNGTIWIGTYNGACTFDGTSFTPFTLPKGKKDSLRGVSSEYMVHSIMEDAQGSIWFGTNAGVCVYDGDTLKQYTTDHGLPSNFINSIIQNSGGGTWVSTAHDGIYTMNGDSFYKAIELYDLYGNSVGPIMLDRNDNMWFVANDTNVCNYDLRKLICYKRRGYFKSHKPFRFYEDNSGRIWSVGLLGAYRLERSEFVNVNREGPW
ncbi:hypothetical protein GYB22_08490 [bacterium]|nr:hypothetical protein [bacterium]